MACPRSMTRFDLGPCVRVADRAPQLNKKMANRDGTSLRQASIAFKLVGEMELNRRPVTQRVQLHHQDVPLTVNSQKTGRRVSSVVPTMSNRK